MHFGTRERLSRGLGVWLKYEMENAADVRSEVRAFEDGSSVKIELNQCIRWPEDASVN